MTSSDLLGHLRAIYRLLALQLFFLGIYPLLLWAQVVDFFLDHARGRRHARWLRQWARGFAAIVGMRAELRGQPPLPPCLLVSNHLSYVDVMLLALHAESIFVAKSEIARWPFIGRICRALNTIFIDRKRKRDLPRIVAAMTDALQKGRTVVFFPEATSTPGRTVLPFKSPLFEAAVRTRCGVRYAALTYQTPSDPSAAHQSVTWWGDMSLLGHLYGLLRLPGFDASILFSSETLRANNRKLLAFQA